MFRRHTAARLARCLDLAGRQTAMGDQICSTPRRYKRDADIDFQRQPHRVTTRVNAAAAVHGAASRIKIHREILSHLGGECPLDFI